MVIKFYKGGGRWGGKYLHFFSVIPFEQLGAIMQWKLLGSFVPLYDGVRRV